MHHRFVIGFAMSFVVWLSCSLLGAGIVSAQETRELRGVVLDEGQGAIAGALVEIVGGAGVMASATTDQDGQYRFASLAPGRYRVRVVVTGFAPFSADVDLRRPRTAPLTAVLRVLIDERVEVVAPSAPGASGGLTSTLLTGDALLSLPNDPGRMLRRLGEMAGATGRSGEVTVTVDGFRRVVRLPPKEMIQMIRISSNPFAPEFAEPGRIRIEIVTKPGSEQFHGEFKSDFNDSWLTARNAFAVEEGSVQTRNVSGYLAGPVVPGRWSFTAYGGRWTELGSDVVNATVLTDAARIPTSFVQNVPTPRTITNVWLGSDVQLGRQHTLAVSYNRTADTAENLGLSGGFDLPERAYGRSVAENAARLSVVSLFGARVLHETRIEYAWNQRLSEALSAAPGLLVLEAFNSGGNQESRFSDSRERNVQFTDHVTMTYRQSTIKAGVQADTTRRRYDDRSDFGGTFVFGADVERDSNGNPVRSVAGDTTAISALESYRRTLLRIPGYGPSQFSVVRGDPRVAFSQRWFGWFVQQDWPVSPRLSVSYGLRQDVQTYAGGMGYLGPRIGIGWRPDVANKSTVRGGVGLFTSRFDTNLTFDIRRLDGVRQRSFVVSRPSFFPAVPDVIVGASSPQLSVYRRAADLRAPRTSMATISYERELGRGMSASAAYTYQRGFDVTRLINANAPDPAANGRRPFPDEGPIMQYESTGRSEQHEVLIALRADLRAVSINGNYTLARMRSDTDGPSTAPADSTNLAAEYGSAATDQRHAAFVSVSRALPWALYASASLTLSSGLPFNITTGRDNNGDTLFTDRPALAAPEDAGAIVTPFGVFNPDPGPGDRIVPRNFGRSAGMARVDLYVSKALQTGPAGKANISISANVENLLNRVNLGGFNGVLSSPAFGLANRALSPRRVQLALSVTF